MIAAIQTKKETSVKIQKVDSAKELHQFIDFPHSLYEGDEMYVPELYVSQELMLNKKKNPFFKHSKADYFLAYKDGKLAGRIAAIRNNNHIEFTGKNQGFFGFFDCIEDYEVAESLLDTAVDWLRLEGLMSVIGPTNLTTNDPCGLLVDGFDTSPYIMSTYNKKYYVDFVEKYGFKGQMNLLSYIFRTKELDQKWINFTKNVEKKLAGKGITFRTIDLKRFKEDVDSIAEIYNSAWDKNWGFVPMTKDEFVVMANEMKQILDKDFVYLAEHNGKTVGFGITLRNINEIQKTIKKGRLFPFGVFKILFGQKSIKSVRILALGILEEYRKIGIDAVMYGRNMETALAKGMIDAEASWILEDNEMMNKGLLNMKAKVYKTHRLYLYNF